MRPREAGRWVLGVLAAGILFGAVTYPALGSSFTADDYVLLRHSTPSSVYDAFRFFVTDWGGGHGGGGYYRPLVNSHSPGIARSSVATRPASVS